MKRYRIAISPDVQRQILDQVNYIAEHSIDNALAWEARLRETLHRIAESPGYAIDEAASRRLNCTLRKAVFEKTYLIHFRVDEAAEVVEFINLRHGARLPRTGEP